MIIFQKVEPPAHSSAYNDANKFVVYRDNSDECMKEAFGNTLYILFCKYMVGLWWKVQEEKLSTYIAGNDCPLLRNRRDLAKELYKFGGGELQFSRDEYDKFVKKLQMGFLWACPMPRVYIVTVRRVDDTKHDIRIDATGVNSFVHDCYEAKVLSLCMDSFKSIAGGADNFHV